MSTCDSRTTVLSLRPANFPPQGLSHSHQVTVRLSKRNTWVDNGRFDADAQALSCRICFTAQRRQVPTGLGNVNGHEGTLICRSKSRKETGARAEVSSMLWFRDHIVQLNTREYRGRSWLGNDLRAMLHHLFQSLVSSLSPASVSTCNAINTSSYFLSVTLHFFHMSLQAKSHVDLEVDSTISYSLTTPRYHRIDVSVYPSMFRQ